MYEIHEISVSGVTLLVSIFLPHRLLFLKSPVFCYLFHSSGLAPLRIS